MIFNRIFYKMSLVDLLPNDIFQVIFSFVKERKNYLSVMLACKKWIVPKERPLALRAKWNKFAYKYLDFSIDDQYAIRSICTRSICN